MSFTLDPEITVRRLLTAIPSARCAFQVLDIPVLGNEEKTLQSVCAAHGISLEQLLAAINQIDWDAEKPPCS